MSESSESGSNDASTINLVVKIGGIGQYKDLIREVSDQEKVEDFAAHCARENNVQGSKWGFRRVVDGSLVPGSSTLSSAGICDCDKLELITVEGADGATKADQKDANKSVSELSESLNHLVIEYPLIQSAIIAPPEHDTQAVIVRANLKTIERIDSEIEYTNQVEFTINTDGSSDSKVLSVEVNTPVFHPNVGVDGRLIRTAGGFEGLSVPDVILHVIDVLSYDPECVAGEETAANGEALSWFRNELQIQPDAFPTDPAWRPSGLILGSSIEKKTATKFSDLLKSIFHLREAAPVRRRQWGEVEIPNENYRKILPSERFAERYSNPYYKVSEGRDIESQFPHIVVKKSCWNEVYSLLASHKFEQGGLLIGRVYGKFLEGHPQITGIEVVDHVWCEPRDSTPVFLTVAPEVWTYANSKLLDDTLIVGWYHSHPNLGAFYSSTDKETQRNVFFHPYSLGVVIDPIRVEEMWHLGKDVKIIPPKFIRMA